jgi:succinyl-CoA synthetase beta subunit
MRFFEYEAREIVKRAGIPVTDFGFATTPLEAHEIAARIGEPVVIKSQVLTGGRMKAGGVQFADTPDEAAAKAEQVLALEINGHVPRGVLVDTRAQVAKEYYAGVVWDGIRKQPVMLFSDMGGIDIEEVAEEHPDHVGRKHFSNLLGPRDFEAKECIASVGVTGRELTRLVPILKRPSSASATRRRARPASPRPSRSPARRSTPWTTAAWPATSPSSTATSAWSSAPAAAR